MEIINLAQSSSPPPIINKPSPKINPKAFVVILILALISGFGFSRLFPTSTPSSEASTGSNSSQSQAQAPESTDQLKPGVWYGSTSSDFPDTAQGTVEAGSINGEGTHILVRAGGLSQRASLTSSQVDLDLFVGKKVEVKGQTNSSNKTSWLMDVGAIKVLE